MAEETNLIVRWSIVVGAVVVIVGAVYGSWQFLVNNSPWAKAEEVAEVQNMLKTLDARDAFGQKDYYQGEFDKHQLKVWELEKEGAPPSIVAPAVRQRDRAKKLLEYYQEQIEGNVGVPVR